MSFGSRLRERRKYLRLSQGALAEILGVTETSVSNYENDNNMPKGEILFSLFNILECDANYLFQDVLRETGDNNILTLEEMQMLNDYRKLTPFNQKAIADWIHQQLEVEQAIRNYSIEESNSEKETYEMMYLPEQNVLILGDYVLCSGDVLEAFILRENGQKEWVEGIIEYNEAKGVWCFISIEGIRPAAGLLARR